MGGCAFFICKKWSVCRPVPPLVISVCFLCCCIKAARTSDLNQDHFGCGYLPAWVGAHISSRRLWIWHSICVHVLSSMVCAVATLVPEAGTVECRYSYNAVQYNMVLYMARQWLRQNINHKLNSPKTPHSSPSWMGYGVSIVRIIDKIDYVLTLPHCS